MIKRDDFWVQYDGQIGTFRGERNGVIYGSYTNEFQEASQILALMHVTLTQEEMADLNAEKGIA